MSWSKVAQMMPSPTSVAAIGTVVGSLLGLCLGASSVQHERDPFRIMEGTLCGTAIGGSAGMILGFTYPISVPAAAVTAGIAFRNRNNCGDPDCDKCP